MSITVEKFAEYNGDDALTKIGGFILLLCLLSILAFIGSFWSEDISWVTIPWIVSFIIGASLVFRGVRIDEREYKEGNLRFREHRFAKFVGGDVDYVDWQRKKSEAYAIAVDFQKRSFYLYINGLMAHVPVDDIREIGWGFYERGNLVVSDLSMIGHKMAYDSAEKQRQWDQSGLSFSVKDVNHPELKVKMGSERLIKKWVEIWHQIVDGTPPQTAKVPVAPASKPG